MRLKMRAIMQAVPDILKWASIPILLIASLFSFYATDYAPVVDYGNLPGCALSGSAGGSVQGIPLGCRTGDSRSDLQPARSYRQDIRPDGPFLHRDISSTVRTYRAQTDPAQ